MVMLGHEGLHAVVVEDRYFHISKSGGKPGRGSSSLFGISALNGDTGSYSKGFGKSLHYFSFYFD
jgi:hypothetical protein